MSNDKQSSTHEEISNIRSRFSLPYLINLKEYLLFNKMKRPAARTEGRPGR